MGEVKQEGYLLCVYFWKRLAGVQREQNPLGECCLTGNLHILRSSPSCYHGVSHVETWEACLLKVICSLSGIQVIPKPRGHAIHHSPCNWTRSKHDQEVLGADLPQDRGMSTHLRTNQSLAGGGMIALFGNAETALEVVYSRMSWRRLRCPPTG